MTIEIGPTPFAVTRYYAGTYQKEEDGEEYDFTIATSSGENHDETLLTITWTDEPEDLLEAEQKIKAEFESFD
jgi:hypothetical protein